jgi:hypothetical protein
LNYAFILILIFFI